MEPGARPDDETNNASAANLRPTPSALRPLVHHQTAGNATNQTIQSANERDDAPVTNDDLDALPESKGNPGNPLPYPVTPNRGLLMLHTGYTLFHARALSGQINLSSRTSRLIQAGLRKEWDGCPIKICWWTKILIGLTTTPLTSTMKQYGPTCSPPPFIGIGS